MVDNYIPSRGDIVWLDFSPQQGHEQSGRRPALVLSPKSYNQKIKLGLFCPITSQIKGYPFEVKLNSNNIDGVILADQIRSLDWEVRKADYICTVDNEILNEVFEKNKVLFQ